MKSPKARQLLQAGFTLIELIIVIVIIGIMAAVAIPRYTSLTNEAQLGVLKGAAGSIASAAATNYALRSGGLEGQGVVNLCSKAIALATVPDEVKLNGTDNALTAGTAGTCSLKYGTTGTQTYDFSVIGS